MIKSICFCFVRLPSFSRSLHSRYISTVEPRNAKLAHFHQWRLLRNPKHLPQQAFSGFQEWSHPFPSQELTTDELWIGSFHHFQELPYYFQHSDLFKNPQTQEHGSSRCVSTTGTFLRNSDRGWNFYSSNRIKKCKTGMFAPREPSLEPRNECIFITGFHHFQELAHYSHCRNLFKNPRLNVGILGSDFSFWIHSSWLLGEFQVLHFNTK